MSVNSQGKTGESISFSDAETDKSHIVQVYIWLANVCDFDEMNVVYDTWVFPGNEPARVRIQGRLADPNLRLEIQAMAGKPDQ